MKFDVCVVPDNENIIYFFVYFNEYGGAHYVKYNVITNKFANIKKNSDIVKFLRKTYNL